MMMWRWTWQVAMAMAAALISLYVAYLVSQFYADQGPSSYEPKDFERQRLMEQTGRSVMDPATQ